MIKLFKLSIFAALLTATSAFAYDNNIVDNFNSTSYSNSTGSMPWDGPWVEFSDSNVNPFSNPDTGAIRLENNGLSFGLNETLTYDKNIVRHFNLEGKKDVEIYTNVSTNNLGSHELVMEIWDIDIDDWVELFRITSADFSGSRIIPNHLLPMLATRYSKIRIKAIDGADWGNTSTNITLDDFGIEFNAKDTDGDGVPDTSDDDIDNDGILNSVEKAVTLTEISPTTTWTKISETKTHGDLGDLIVELQESTDVLFDDVISMAAMNSSGKGFWTPESVNSIVAAPALALVLRGDENEIRELKINLPKASKKVLVHIDRLGAWDYTQQPFKTTSANFTLIDSSLGNGTTGFTMTKLSDNGNMVVDSTGYFFHRRLNDLANGSTDSYPTDGGAGAGTIEISNNTAFTSLTFDIETLDVNGVRATLGDGIYLMIESETDSTGSHDTDSDGISDEFDLDSDNDGIPDSIEAQATVTPVYIVGKGNVDTDGIPNEVSSQGLTPVDTDSDGEADFVDDDSDNDDILDCIEGNKNIVDNDLCPITTVSADGMSTDAGSDGNYSNIFGNVDDVTTKLVGWNGSTEVAYRVATYCGTPSWNLTADQWKTISVPCSITEGIDEIFSTLGTYGDDQNWVMYRQESDFSGKSSSMLLMSSNELMVPGQGYWIITDQDKNVIIDEPSLTVSKTTRVLATDHSVVSPDFTEVHTDKAMPASSVDIQKVLLGNPFPLPIHLGNVFLSHAGSDYYPMYDTSNMNFAKNIVYTYDHTGRDPIHYVAKTAAGTPGFGDSIAPGLGFWLRLETGSGTNKIDFPFEK